MSGSWANGNDRDPGGGGGSSSRWSGGSGGPGSGGGGGGSMNSSNQFLESAANIMMGVGLSGGSSRGGGSDRYEQYKSSLTGSGRRY